MEWDRVVPVGRERGARAKSEIFRIATPHRSPRELQDLTNYSFLVASFVVEFLTYHPSNISRGL